MVNRIVKFYIYSNLHISVCAAVYVFGAIQLSGGNSSITIFPLFVFCSTFLVYNAHRFIGARVDPFKDLPERFSYSKAHAITIITLNLLATIALVYSLSQMDVQFMFWLVPIGITTGLYIIPIIPKRKRLRDVAFIKIFLISLVWAAIFVLPLVSTELGRGHNFWLLLLFLEKTAFFIALTLPFDIRDLYVDKRVNLITVANYIGIEKTMYAINLLIAFSMIITLILTWAQVYTWVRGLSLLIFYLILRILLTKSEREKHEFYFLGILDGQILVHGLLFLI